jgi:hypothetical protein
MVMHECQWVRRLRSQYPADHFLEHRHQLSVPSEVSPRGADIERRAIYEITSTRSDSAQLGKRNW